MVEQLTLESHIAKNLERQAAAKKKRLRFDGADYDHERDSGRLTDQLSRVYAAVRSGQWLTLHQIACQCGDPEASVSAQLRHLRKDRFGGYVIERRHVKNGLYEYRMALDDDGLPKRVF